MDKDNLKTINSVCKTPEDLIKSEYFIRGLNFILEKIETYDKIYITSIFIKLKHGFSLEDREIHDLNHFISDFKVFKIGQELLSKLKNVGLNVETSNFEEFKMFSILLNDIFSENGFKMIQGYIGKIAYNTGLILDEYKGYTKISIEINGKTKEIYLEDENLKVDTNGWEEVKIGGQNVKINTEGDIIEYIEGDIAGEQLFSWPAAIRESRNQGKRLPFADDDNLEFPAIIKEIGIDKFKGTLPGGRDLTNNQFGDIGEDAYFWTASHNGDTALIMAFYKEGDESYRFWNHDAFGFSVRCIKD